MRISYSLLETYKQCPQKYKFQQIEKRKAPKSKEALFGTAVHEALKFMFSRDPLFPTLEEVLARFRETFIGSVTHLETLSEADRTRYITSGEAMLKQFYAKNPPWNFNVVDTEAHFEVALDDTFYNTKHVLVGKIDRIDKIEGDTYEVIDYKTSRRLPSQVAVDENMQLAIYQLGLLKRWPNVNPSTIRLSLYFLKAGEKFSTTRPAESLKKVEENVLSTLHTIEEKTRENNFPPTPSALCDWCPFKPICPAWSHLYKKPEEKREIDEIVQEYFMLKNEIEEREKKLAPLSHLIREYLDREKLDRIFSGAGTITRSAQERTVWNDLKVKEILGDNPIFLDLLTIDPKKLKKVLATLPYDTQERLKNEARTVRQFSMMKVSKKMEKPDTI